MNIARSIANDHIAKAVSAETQDAYAAAARHYQDAIDELYYARHVLATRAREISKRMDTVLRLASE